MNLYLLITPSRMCIERLTYSVWLHGSTRQELTEDVSSIIDCHMHIFDTFCSVVRYFRGTLVLLGAHERLHKGSFAYNNKSRAHKKFWNWEHVNKEIVENLKYCCFFECAGNNKVHGCLLFACHQSSSVLTNKPWERHGIWCLQYKVAQVHISSAGATFNDKTCARRFEYFVCAVRNLSETWTWATLCMYLYSNASRWANGPENSRKHP